MLITEYQKKSIKYDWCRYSATCYKCMQPFHKVNNGKFEGCPKNEDKCEIACIISGKSSAKDVVSATKSV